MFRCVPDQIYSKIGNKEPFATHVILVDCFSSLTTLMAVLEWEYCILHIRKLLVLCACIFTAGSHGVKFWWTGHEQALDSWCIGSLHLWSVGSILWHCLWINTHKHNCRIASVQRFTFYFLLFTIEMEFFSSPAPFSKFSWLCKLRLVCFIVPHLFCNT
jgi:hypothetical protein